MTNDNAHLRRVAEAVDRYGHAVQYVGDGRAPYAYTVGLHTGPDRGYELALSGLDVEISHNVLNSFAVMLADSGLDPFDRLEVKGLLRRGLALRLRPVSRPEDFAIVHALYGVTPPAWQILWPDQRNQFPGDAHCLLSEDAQPLL
ncbi:DUF4262 domain-containing protein [Streptomyces sp. NPDC054796]